MVMLQSVERARNRRATIIGSSYLARYQA